MPLTPADVHNVAFSKPPIGKRGYNEDEVDAFLDLVEAELARLIEENDDLREQVSQLEQRLGNAQADLDEARSRPQAAMAAPAATQQMQRPVEPPPMPQRPMEPPRGMAGPEPDFRGGDLGGDHHVQAAKVLGLAQEMADRLTAEAKSEADSMLADARNKSEQLLSDARAALTCRFFVYEVHRDPYPLRLGSFARMRLGEKSPAKCFAFHGCSVF